MTDLIEVNVSEIIGAALDWAVMVAVKGEKTKHEFQDGKLYLLVSKQLMGHCQEISEPFMPSTRWQEGGPLIESNELTVKPSAWDWRGVCVLWRATEEGVDTDFEHTNLLVAAMRAVVHAKLGPVVSVPKELIHE
jgi:hypothetical protein